MNYFISKSKYVRFISCNKRLWLDKYKKEYRENRINEGFFIHGNIVGELARDLFGDYYLAKTDDNDLLLQAENTKLALERGENVICEASFFFENNYCAVDILKRDENGCYSLYEVKSSTKASKFYYDDIAYQYFVLNSLNIPLNSVNLIYVNKDYIFDGKLDLSQFFNILDITEEVKEKLEEVKENIGKANEMLSNPTEPDSIMGSVCNRYDDCPFFSYCKKYKNIPLENSVYDLYSNSKKAKQIKNNILSFQDLVDNKVSLNEIQKRQIDFALNNRDDYHVDKEKVYEFLNELIFPLYFFDFESYQSAIPVYIGSKPYQQITFQYSLHILNSDGTVEHKEFLGDGFNDPTFDIINAMISDLGESGSIIAYNDRFEKDRIKEMMDIMPEYKEKLEKLLPRFIDLAKIFQNGYIYNRLMGGSFSIKSVLPALFPNDEVLNYENLEGVHRGDEAAWRFLR